MGAASQLQHITFELEEIVVVEESSLAGLL